MPTGYDLVVRQETRDETLRVLEVNWNPVATDLPRQQDAEALVDDRVPPGAAWRIIRRTEDGAVVSVREEHPPETRVERRRGSPRRPPGPGGDR
jgi:hypothetical protein